MHRQEFHLHNMGREVWLPYRKVRITKKAVQSNLAINNAKTPSLYPIFVISIHIYSKTAIVFAIETLTWCFLWHNFNGPSAACTADAWHVRNAELQNRTFHDCNNQPRSRCDHVGSACWLADCEAAKSLAKLCTYLIVPWLRNWTQLLYRSILHFHDQNTY